jgi:VanZ family protein
MSLALDDGFYVHILGYFAGSALARAAFGQKGRWEVVVIPLGLLTLGALLEAAHYFIPARTFNPTDILGNVLGVLLFYGCLVVFLTFRREGGKTHWK